MLKTRFKINKMDCPSEENLIRMKLENLDSIYNQEYDLVNRTITIIHAEHILADLETNIHDLNLRARRISSEEYTGVLSTISDSKKQSHVLWVVLAINFIFFVIEITTGIISKSMGLVADSLDMLADSFVYGLSLFAVGSTLVRKKKVAMISGLLQIGLAIIGFVEVIRRFIGMEKIPIFQTMIGISLLALIANIVSLVLLLRTRSDEAHIQASIIFSSNDIIINIGVIIAGFLVWQLNSSIPDLLIGAIVFLIVIRGAVRILKLAKN